MTMTAKNTVNPQFSIGSHVVTGPTRAVADHLYLLA